MHRISTLSGNGGHPRGGPFCFRALPILAVALLAACGGTRMPTEGARPARGQPFARPLDIYSDMGFLTGTVQFPAVAGFTTLAGPADSSLVMLSLSIPNSALRFQRSDDGFFAEYTLAMTFMDTDSAVVKHLETRETVRVPTFGETGRTEESVIFQFGAPLLPGEYIVHVAAADANSSRGFEATDTLTVPAYAPGAAAVSQPLLVYSGTGRATRDAAPAVVANPRNTVPYGGDSPLLYIETYGAVAPLRVDVTGEGGDTVWAGTVQLDGESDLRHGLVEIPAAALPLGRLWVSLSGEGLAPAAPTPLMMTISDQWMVSNFGDVLQFLEYIAFKPELDSLAAGGPAERRQAWERFWDRRDPLPVTEINEFRDAFFHRVRYATEAFREPGGRAGWATHRGEVYIVLGAPEAAVERLIGETDVTGQANAEEWVYSGVTGGRINLVFHDRTGFGRYELIPSSAATFRSVADRLKRSNRRN